MTIPFSTPSNLDTLFTTFSLYQIDHCRLVVIIPLSKAISTFFTTFPHRIRWWSGDCKETIALINISIEILSFHDRGGFWSKLRLVAFASCVCCCRLLRLHSPQPSRYRSGSYGFDPFVYVPVTFRSSGLLVSYASNPISNPILILITIVFEHLRSPILVVQSEIWLLYLRMGSSHRQRSSHLAEIKGKGILYEDDADQTDGSGWYVNRQRV